MPQTPFPLTSLTRFDALIWARQEANRLMLTEGMSITDAILKACAILRRDKDIYVTAEDVMPPQRGRG
jgi:hypothetical protein